MCCYICCYICINHTRFLQEKQFFKVLYKLFLIPCMRVTSYQIFSGIDFQLQNLKILVLVCLFSFLSLFFFNNKIKHSDNFSTAHG